MLQYPLSTKFNTLCCQEYYELLAFEDIHCNDNYLQRNTQNQQQIDIVSICIYIYIYTLFRSLIIKENSLVVFILLIIFIIFEFN